MPRRHLNRPWLHAASGYFCTTIDRKRVYLDKDYRASCQKLRAMRLAQRTGDARINTEWLDATLVELADVFLDDIEARKRPETHRAYRHRLLRALRILGTTIRVGEVRKLHLAQIEGALIGSLSPTTVKDTLAAVQAVFGWAVRHDLLDVNPLVGYQKPRARARSRIIDEDEFRILLRASDARFRRALLALRLTGCRPAEVRNLIWEWVDLENGFWTLPEHKTITTQRHPRPRIVPLPEPIWRMCRWMAREPHEPSDRVFTNSRNLPYTKDCFCRKMARVRTRARLTAKAGERIVLYSARHTFATQSAGLVTDLELAELLGHTDVRTTRRYVHLNANRLREIPQRAGARLHVAPGNGAKRREKA